MKLDSYGGIFWPSGGIPVVTYACTLLAMPCNLQHLVISPAPGLLGENACLSLEVFEGGFYEMSIC